MDLVKDLETILELLKIKPLVLDLLTLLKKELFLNMNSLVKSQLKLLLLFMPVMLMDLSPLFINLKKSPLLKIKQSLLLSVNNSKKLLWMKLKMF
jgi:hypothetical protein